MANTTKESELNWGQRVALESLWASSRLFAVLPYWFKFHVVGYLFFLLLYYIARYRMKVVRENLRNSFPEKSEHELAVICRKFYRTLAEIFVHTINLAGMSSDKARSMVSVKNLEQHRKAVHGRDWVAMTAHFGCWEYCSFWGLLDSSQMLVGVYHPLGSKIMECYYRRLRRFENSMAVPMQDCLRFYLRNREHGIDGKNLVMGLISDQNPPKRPDSHWFRFLNQDSLFFDGGTKLAMKCKLPIYFVKMIRMQPGRYEISFELLYDGVEEVAETEITERYVRRLESLICEYPELWLWSHRRWKHKRPNVNS